MTVWHEPEYAEFPRTGPCVLCGRRYTRYGCNPDPVAPIENGRCCHSCDRKLVYPARIAQVLRAVQEGGDAA